MLPGSGRIDEGRGGELVEVPTPLEPKYLSVKLFITPAWTITFSISSAVTPGTWSRSNFLTDAAWTYAPYSESDMPLNRRDENPRACAVQQIKIWAEEGEEAAAAGAAAAHGRATGSGSNIPLAAMWNIHDPHVSSCVIHM